jgi:putative NADPH-quinone reductase
MTKTSSKRILILLGHPSGDSFCAALAEAYAESARAQGHAVRELRLGQLDFDPSLHEGYRQVQPLEADLLAAQEAICGPNTWCSPTRSGGAARRPC